MRKRRLIEEVESRHGCQPGAVTPRRGRFRARSRSMGIDRSPWRADVSACPHKSKGLAMKAATWHGKRDGRVDTSRIPGWRSRRLAPDPGGGVPGKRRQRWRHLVVGRLMFRWASDGVNARHRFRSEPRNPVPRNG